MVSRLKLRVLDSSYFHGVVLLARLIIVTGKTRVLRIVVEKVEYIMNTDGGVLMMQEDYIPLLTTWQQVYQQSVKIASHFVHSIPLGISRSRIPSPARCIPSPPALES